MAAGNVRYEFSLNEWNEKSVLFMFVCGTVHDVSIGRSIPGCAFNKLRMNLPFVLILTVWNVSFASNWSELDDACETRKKIR